MSALIVDTSSWIGYIGGQPNSALSEALFEGRVYLPPIVVAELLSGSLPPAQRDALGDALRELPLCASEFSHWQRVGCLRAHLRNQGLSVSTPDAHIAQCALDLNGFLLSEDKVFARIALHSQLQCV